VRLGTAVAVVDPKVRFKDLDRVAPIGEEGFERPGENARRRRGPGNTSNRGHETMDPGAVTEREPKERSDDQGFARGNGDVHGSDLERNQGPAGKVEADAEAVAPGTFVARPHGERTGG